ncbi:MAG: ferredoxin reductase [Actinomycetes bacterium]
MARAAILGRLTWQVATVESARTETATARTLVLDVPDWPGHLPGQHVDVRLTAADGYSTQRSYSIANASEPGRVELTVQRVADGEVSPYLTELAEPGDQFELRGPIGGYFTWSPVEPAPVLLVAGGSGIVPLMAMIRTRSVTGSRAPFRLIYSSRGPDDVIYATELDRLAAADGAAGELEISYVYTRSIPAGWPSPPGRLDSTALAVAGWPPDREPLAFVCGPTGFVEAVSGLLVEQGHAPNRIKTERFGPTGGAR